MPRHMQLSVPNTNTLQLFLEVCLCATNNRLVCRISDELLTHICGLRSHSKTAASRWFPRIMGYWPQVVISFSDGRHLHALMGELSQIMDLDQVVLELNRLNWISLFYVVCLSACRCQTELDCHLVKTQWVPGSSEVTGEEILVLDQYVTFPVPKL